MIFGGQAKYAYVGVAGVDEDRRIVDALIDEGINFIDTTDIVSAGANSLPRGCRPHRRYSCGGEQEIATPRPVAIPNETDNGR
jgi:hypothetical protein